MVCRQLNMEESVAEIMNQLGADENGKICFQDFTRCRMQLIREIRKEEIGLSEKSDNSWRKKKLRDRIASWPTSSDNSLGRYSPVTVWQCSFSPVLWPSGDRAAQPVDGLSPGHLLGHICPGWELANPPVLKPFISAWDLNPCVGTRTQPESCLGLEPTWLGFEPRQNPQYLVSGPNEAQVLDVSSQKEFRERQRDK